MKKRWAQLRANPWFKLLSNKFTLATLFFLVWMTFLDVNSMLIHWQLNQEIDDLETSIDYYRTEIERDSLQLMELSSDPEKLEKFAREQYWLHKPNEEIYLIDQSGE